MNPREVTAVLLGERWHTVKSETFEYLPNGHFQFRTLSDDTEFIYGPLSSIQAYRLRPVA